MNVNYHEAMLEAAYAILEQQGIVATSRQTTQEEDEITEVLRVPLDCDQIAELNFALAEKLAEAELICSGCNVLVMFLPA